MSLEKFSNKNKIENKISVSDKLLIMYEKAPEAKIYIDKLAEYIANKYHGLVLKTELKSFEESLHKIKTKGDEYIDKIIDIARNTVIVDKENILEAYQDLSLNDELINKYRIKKKDMPISGYIGAYFRIKCPNGLIAEIQLSTPEMIVAKEEKTISEKILGKEKYKEIIKKAGVEGGLGHKIYAKLRNLKEDTKEYQDLSEISRKYYEHFY